MNIPADTPLTWEELKQQRDELREALVLCANELGFNDEHDLAFDSDLAGIVRAALATGDK